MICYAVAQCGAADDAPSTRVPRAVQSAAARTLQARLGEGLASRSHSRTMVAAAVGDAAAVGIDIEYRDPARNRDAILRVFDPEHAGPVEIDTFYTSWTFIEAFYKAFGRYPEPALIRRVASAALATTVALGEGAFALHRPVGACFMLALVWQGDAAVEDRTA